MRRQLDRRHHLDWKWQRCIAYYFWINAKHFTGFVAPFVRKNMIGWGLANTKLISGNRVSRSPYLMTLNRTVMQISRLSGELFTCILTPTEGFRYHKRILYSGKKRFCKGVDGKITDYSRLGFRIFIWPNSMKLYLAKDIWSSISYVLNLYNAPLNR